MLGSNLAWSGDGKASGTRSVAEGRSCGALVMPEPDARSMMSLTLPGRARIEASYAGSVSWFLG